MEESHTAAEQSGRYLDIVIKLLQVRARARAYQPSAISFTGSRVSLKIQWTDVIVQRKEEPVEQRNSVTGTLK